MLLCLYDTGRLNVLITTAIVLTSTRCSTGISLYGLALHSLITRRLSERFLDATAVLEQLRAHLVVLGFSILVITKRELQPVVAGCHNSTFSTPRSVPSSHKNQFKKSHSKRQTEWHLYCTRVWHIEKGRKILWVVVIRQAQWKRFLSQRTRKPD